MSRTTNVQNLLVNVLRPVYSYDATTTLFTPKLELSNVDTYSGNTVSVFTAAVGDANSNVYVGSNAGNPYTTMKASRNNTAIGYGAGFNNSNVSNSTYLGFNAGAGAVSASNVVAIGVNAIGNGTANVFVGANTGGTGNSNIFIGGSNTGSGSSNILIGQGLTSDASNNVFRLGTNYLTGDLSAKWLGIGTLAPNDVHNRLDVSGNVYVFGQQGINMTPIRTLDVNGNFRSVDSNGVLDFSNGSTRSTGGFVSIQSNIVFATGPITSSLGAVRRGLISVSAVDRASSVNRAAAIFFAHTASNIVLVSGSSNGTLSLPADISTNIGLSNTTGSRTVDFSVTYFPLT